MGSDTGNVEWFGIEGEGMVMVRIEGKRKMGGNLMKKERVVYIVFKWRN